MLDARSERLLKWMEWIAFFYFLYGHVYLVQNRRYDTARGVEGKGWAGSVFFCAVFCRKSNGLRAGRSSG